MRVVVCGGGIGGLVVAQALRDVADVLVLERDLDAAATGGYRLHLGERACRVLETVLDPGLMTDIRSTSDGKASFAQFTIATTRLDPMVIAAEDPAADRLLAQRRALRILLTRGLGDRLQLGSVVSSVRQDESAAEVTLIDGRTYSADVVVGADGSQSPTVASLHAASTSIDLAMTGIAGSTPVAPDQLPAFLRRGPGLAFAANGVAMFLSATTAPDGPVPGDIAAVLPPPSLVWGLICQRKRLPAELPQDGRELNNLVGSLLRRWDPWLRRTVLDGDAERTAAFAFRSADPKKDLTPWRSGRITAVGDAVHAMPPTGGQGAATAVLDAGHLAGMLRAHARGDIGLSDAIASYQVAMPDWARPAIRESLGPVRVIRLLANPVLSAAATPLLAAAGAVGRRHYAGRS